MKDCNGECANCGYEAVKCFIENPIRYYVMYVVKGYVGMGCSDSVRKVELLKYAATEKQAIEEAKKWIRRMRKKGKKKENRNFELLSAQLVASAHIDVLKLV